MCIRVSSLLVGCQRRSISAKPPLLSTPSAKVQWLLRQGSPVAYRCLPTFVRRRQSASNLMSENGKEADCRLIRRFYPRTRAPCECSHYRGFSCLSPTPTGSAGWNFPTPRSPEGWNRSLSSRQPYKLVRFPINPPRCLFPQNRSLTRPSIFQRFPRHVHSTPRAITRPRRLRIRLSVPRREADRTRRRRLVCRVGRRHRRQPRELYSRCMEPRRQQRQRHR